MAASGNPKILHSGFNRYVEHFGLKKSPEDRRRKSAIFLHNKEWEANLQLTLHCDPGVIKFNGITSREMCLFLNSFLLVNHQFSKYYTNKYSCNIYQLLGENILGLS